MYSNNHCLVFSHSKDSPKYFECDTKYGDCWENINSGFNSGRPWQDKIYDIRDVLIENKIKPQNMKGMFEYLTVAQNITGLNKIDTSNCTSFNRTFYAFAYDSSGVSLDLSSWNTSKVTNMEDMFNSKGLTAINVSNFNTSKVTTMNRMFYNLTNVQSLDLSSFDMISVTTAEGMFNSSTGIKSIVFGNVNSVSLTNMSSMFSYCKQLESVNLSSFNTAQVTHMGSLFNKCEKLQNLDLGSFDTRNVEYFSSMFSECSSLNNIIYGNNFIKKQGCTTYNMFNKCPANKPSWW